MITQSIEPIVEDALHLLVFVIAADERIYPEEIDVFLNVSLDMKLSDGSGKVLTRAWLLDWFLQNYEKAQADITNSEADIKIVHLFMRLQSWPKKQQLLDACCSVAGSDGNYDLSERVLIALAAAYWDMKTPAMK